MPSKKQPTKPKRARKVKTRRAVIKRARKAKQQDEIFGFMAGKFNIVGDIESPVPDWFSRKKK